MLYSHLISLFAAMVILTTIINFILNVLALHICITNNTPASRLSSIIISVQYAVPKDKSISRCTHIAKTATELSSSAVECNKVSPGSNPDWAFSFSPLVPQLTHLYK